jgi:hypothetical protein
MSTKHSPQSGKIRRTDQEDGTNRMHCREAAGRRVPQRLEQRNCELLGIVCADQAAASPTLTMSRGRRIRGCVGIARHIKHRYIRKISTQPFRDGRTTLNGHDNICQQKVYARVS